MAAEGPNHLGPKPGRRGTNVVDGDQGQDSTVGTSRRVHQTMMDRNKLTTAGSRAHCVAYASDMCEPTIRGGSR